MTTAQLQGERHDKRGVCAQISWFCGVERRVGGHAVAAAQGCDRLAAVVKGDGLLQSATERVR
jgi:hypothetical protein